MKLNEAAIRAEKNQPLASHGYLHLPVDAIDKHQELGRGEEDPELRKERFIYLPIPEFGHDDEINILSLVLLKYNRGV